MKLRSLATSIAFAALMASGAQADCNPNVKDEASTANFPHLTGKLFYTTWSIDVYGRRILDTGQIAYYDFASGTNVPISQPSWKTSGHIVDILNPVLSADEHWVLFMANTNDQAWNIYMYRLGSNTLPVNLTNSVGATRNEDPKFSADQTKVVFKRTQNGASDIEVGNLAWASGNPYFTSYGNYTHNPAGVESSMPFYSTDPAWIYYTIGSGDNLQVYYRSVNGGTDNHFDGTSQIKAYYPIVRNDYHVNYARWHDAASMLDQIYQKNALTATPIELSFNDCNSNNSDPAPVNGTSLTFFSSTENGRYELFLGDAVTGQRWNMSLFGLNSDTGRAYVGAYYQ